MDRATEHLLLALPLPALLVGPDERILAANAGAEALLGAGARGRHYMTLLRQPDLLDAVEAALRDGAARDTRYLGNDGARDTTFITRCAPVQNGDGQRSVLVSFEDITHLEQASQMRRDFVANVSHELRSPLTAMLGFIETLRGPARDDAAASDRFLGIMQGEAERMERLVRDLLSLSRVEAEERVRPRDPVNLTALAQSMIHTLSPLAEEAGVALVLEAPEPAITVPGDSDQLRQVLTNLTENAIKYGGPDKTVTLSLETLERSPDLRGPVAILAVRDQGPGIDAVHIPRLTERFYRVDDHRSREMGGTGLGLAIVKHIMNRHRGRLRIRSTQGQGSEFRVILPL